MPRDEKKKKIIVIGGVLLVLLCVFYIFFFKKDIPKEGDQKDLFFVDNETGAIVVPPGEGPQGDPGWYIGYFNVDMNQFFYSEAVKTKTECERDEELMRRDPAKEVKIGCFEVVEKGNVPTIADNENISQNENPELVILGGSVAHVVKGTPYIDEGAYAYDKKDGDITLRIQTTGLPVDSNTIGVYQVVYSITDSDGNSVSAVRVVRVVENDDGYVNQSDQSTPPSISDTEPPRISSIGAVYIIVPFGRPYKDAGVVAFDAVDGDLTNKIVSQGLPINTTTPGQYTVVFTVSDNAGNKAELKKIVKVESSTDVDMSTDLAYLKSCLEKRAEGLCAKADLTKDGFVDSADQAYAIQEGAKYELNRDGSIELSLGDEVHSCFFKIFEGRNYVCAKDSYGSVVITKAYLAGSLTQKIIESSLDPASEDVAVDLNILSEKLNSSPLDQIALATIAQYDFNIDGIADFSVNSGTNEDVKMFEECQKIGAAGSCIRADINQDGVLNDWDLEFLNIIQSPLLPDTFTVGQFDAVLFDWRLYTDARIVSYCASSGVAQGNCENADINKDGVVNQTDVSMFGQAHALDLNGDGVVDGDLVGALSF